MNKKEILTLAVSELIRKGNTGIIPVVFSVKYKAYAGGKKYGGHAFIKRWNNQIREAIGNLKVLKVEFLSENAQTVTWQRRLSGVHKAKLKGIPPLGKKITWNEMVISRFENNKIAEERVVSELAGELMIKQFKGNRS